LGRKQRDNLTVSEKEDIRRYLAKRDGRKCVLCRTDPVAGLEIDHINGNPLDWDYENLRLLCGTCNKKQAWALRHHNSLKEREKVGDKAIVEATLAGRLSELSMSWEGRRKLELQDVFEPLLNDMLLKGAVTVKDAQNRLGFLTGADQQTVTRWLDRMTTLEGPFMLSARVVKDQRSYKTLQFISRKANMPV